MSAGIPSGVCNLSKARSEGLYIFSMLAYALLPCHLMSMVFLPATTCNAVTMRFGRFCGPP